MSYKDEYAFYEKCKEIYLETEQEYGWDYDNYSVDQCTQLLGILNDQINALIEHLRMEEMVRRGNYDTGHQEAISSVDQDLSWLEERKHILEQARNWKLGSG
ncbi:hypothetical protein LTR66_007204 [Elasticomyces elasticus]|nr:hypothetical protein LTR28_000650 [Elasticomyces elasticus]KAK4988860.1 hypothetical protein LTR66_007204 [Elasticomyces elasticus]